MQGPTGAPGQPGEPVSSFVNTLYCTIDHSREFMCYAYIGYSWTTRRERRARGERRSWRSSKLFSKINVETAKI